MNMDEKLGLIKRMAEEIVTEQELYELLKEKKHPIAYDGFEPSGMAHVPFGIYRAMNLKDMLKAGLHFKLLLADWHAWINNKMGGDLDKIKTVGKYFIEVWKAGGVDISKIDVVWASDLVASSDYWKKVVLVAKNTTLKRATRCLSIMGRKAGELKDVAQYFYPMMQCADIFHLEADICQLGLDQRRVNMLARELGPKLGWWKPVIISHHMLMGLQGVKEPEGFDDNTAFDREISSKMSKSKASTCIFVHDTEEQIREKIRRAYCPEKQVQNNPMLDYTKHMIFRSFKTMKIERQKKFGGDIEFSGYEDLERAYIQGNIHPLDLKNAIARYLDTMIKPVREHFEKNEKARELYEFVKKQKVTR